MLCTYVHTAMSTVQMHKRADTDFVHDVFFMGHTKGTCINYNIGGFSWKDRRMVGFHFCSSDLRGFLVKKKNYSFTP